MIVAAESGGRPLALPTLLVGRARERARLREALAAALAGRGSLVLIEGDLGIGKTALARAVSREAAERGAAVQLCQSYDLTQASPFHLWLELVARWSPTLEPNPALGATNGALDHALPAVSPALPLPAPTDLDQLTRFGQLRDLIVAEVQQRPLCLVLEDLQWADEASLELLRFLTRTLATLPLLIVGTYRDYEVTPKHVLYRLLPLLTREGGAIRLDLAPLDDEAVRTLLWTRYGLAADDEARLVALLRDRAAGNPLFIEEFLRTAEETKVLQQLHDVHGADRAWRVGEATTLPLPPLLKQTLDARIARLSPDATRLLSIAATIGNEVPIDLWGQVARVDDETILALVERAVEAKLVAETPDGTLMRFRHPLVREALYEGLSAARRRIWHLRAGELLAAAQQPSADPAAVAYHFRQAGDGRAIKWLTLAGERALHHADWARAAARFGEAADLLHRSGDDEPTRGMLLYRRAQLSRYDDPASGLAYLREAEAIAGSLPDRVLGVLIASTRALLRSINGQLHWAIGEMEEALQVWGGLTAEERRRLEALDVGHGEFSAWGMLASTLALVGRYQEARVIAERIIAAPPQERTALDGSPLGNAYLTLGIVHAARGALIEARTAYGRAREAYRAINHQFLVGAAALRELEAVLRYATDDLATRTRLAEEADEALVYALGASFPRHTARLPLLVIEGRWGEARELAEARRQLPRGIAMVGPLELATIARAQGDLATAWQIVERQLPAKQATPPGDAPYGEVLGLLHIAIGLAYDADDLIAMRGWLDTLDRWLAWGATAPGVASGACDGFLAWAVYHRALGDLAQARTLAQEAHAAAATPRQPLLLVATERFLGELDTAEGAFDAALGHLRGALDLAAACAAPYERALTLLSCAELALTQATAEAAPEAHAEHLRQAHLELDEARALCTPLGAHPALARAAALAVRLGAVAPAHAPVAATAPITEDTLVTLAPAVVPEPPPPASGHAPAAEWLTPREGEVLRLIAGGLSNREIAAKLFLSVRTAERHIANIYKKIGAHSKADATAFAFNNGLL